MIEEERGKTEKKRRTWSMKAERHPIQSARKPPKGPPLAPPIAQIAVEILPSSPRFLSGKRSLPMIVDVVFIPPPPAPARKRAAINAGIDGARAQPRVPRAKRKIALALARRRPMMSQRRP